MVPTHLSQGTLYLHFLFVSLMVMGIIYQWDAPPVEPLPLTASRINIALNTMILTTG